jgi:cation:H+ antiporter
LASKEHAAIPVFSTVMMSFVIPITVITLVVMILRKPRTGIS